MRALSKTMRHAALAAVLAGLVAVPALARLDVYRCMAMRSTHVGRCCGMHRAHDRAASLRAEKRPCCALQSRGTEPPPAHAAAVMPIVAAPASTVVAEVLVGPSLAPIAQRVAIRSRAPPSAPLWLANESFLL